MKKEAENFVDRIQKELIPITANGWYAKEYVKWEKTYWYDIIDWISEDFLGKKNLKCLDIGSGYGTLLVYCQKLLGSTSYCINDKKGFLDTRVIEKFKIKAKYRNIELEEFPFEEKFDIILLTAVLEHFNFNPVPTLKKLHAALKEEGVFYVSVPNSNSYWGKLTKYFNSIENMPMPNKELYIDGGHHYHYTNEELQEIFSISGFKITKIIDSYGIYNLRIEK